MQALGDPCPGPDQSKSDSHCWSCHRIETQLFCSTCPRSFHISPACSHAKKMSAEMMGLWRCQCCRAVEKDEALLLTNETKLSYINEILNFVSTLLLEDEWLCNRGLRDIDYSNVKSTVFNPMDMARLGKKTENKEYSCYEAFWADVKWIEHNVKVHLAYNALAVEGTKWLLDFTREELYNIRLCHECYFNANQRKDDWFTKPCSIPHILVYAKQPDFPYWPAKLMLNLFDDNKDKKVFDVKFFGDHKRTTISPKNILMLSKESVSSNFGKLKDKYDESLKEVMMHVQNLIMKFGSFHFAEPNTSLNVTMLERHLYNMVPGAWKNLGHIEVPAEIPKTNVRRRQSIRKNVPPLSHELNYTPDRPITRRMSRFETPTEPVVPETANTILFTLKQVNKRKDARPKSEVKKPRIETKTSTSEVNVPDRRAEVAVGSSAPTPEQSPVQAPRARKTFPGPAPITVIPLSNITLADQKKMHVPIKIKEEDLLEPKDDLVLTSDFGNDLIDTSVEHSSDMFTIAKAMVDQNTKKVTECIRSSLQTTLFGLLDAACPTIQGLEEQLANQRNYFESLVKSLQTQSSYLSDQLNKSKSSNQVNASKYDDLKSKYDDLKSKNAALTIALAKEQSKNSDVNSTLHAISNKNSVLMSTLNKNRMASQEQANQLLRLKMESDNLTATNKALMETNAQLKYQLNNSSLEKVVLTNQLNELRRTPLV